MPRQKNDDKMMDLLVNALQVGDTFYRDDGIKKIIEECKNAGLSIRYIPNKYRFTGLLKRDSRFRVNRKERKLTIWERTN